MWLLVLNLLALRLLPHIAATIDYSEFEKNGHTHAASAYITSVLSQPGKYEQRKPSWSPRVKHNNWIILQSSASNDAAALDEPLQSLPNQAQHYITKVTTSSLNNYANQQKKQKYPLASQYYSYNSGNNENYNLPSKDMRNNEPYVLTISKQQRQIMPFSVSNNQNQHQRKINNNSQILEWENLGHLYRDANNVNNSSNIIQMKHKNGAENNRQNFIVKQQPLSSLYGLQNIENKENSEYIDHDNGNNNAHVDISRKVGYVKNIVNSMENVDLNEALTPLATILDGVKYYCEMLKEIVNGDDEDLSNNELKPLHEVTAAVSRTASDLSTQTAGDTTQMMTTKVQGQHTGSPTSVINHLIMQQSAETKLLSPTTIIRKTTQLNTPRSSMITASPSAPASVLNTTIATVKSLTSADFFIGRGKKLKKKMKKLMLPLLLAYKLKFIALVPLLIGGLTLLVGSTGLAGFFFALFVTVMALKGGVGGG
ncbi:myb-like protein Z [Eurosta solidaginis]|uniref:myb-like protein Z n=1 Tax=Eurosta solidaginis TaxID=178769 RepID=UPI00353101E9